jgi:hypothetical protein
MLALLRERHEQGRVIGGWQQIVDRLQQRIDDAARKGRSSFLLWGTYHDSKGQVEAFRRLVGPMGLRDLTAVVAEQLVADGRWAKVGFEEQAGDSASLRRYLKTGSADAWRSLLAQQHRANYTAWKYRYLHAVMDLAVTARASGLLLSGCDMSQDLQQRALVIGLEQRVRLRELHCMLALRERLARAGRVTPHRVAMLWGQDHVTVKGVRRFLPPSALALSLYLVGHRPGPHGVGFVLATTLRSTDPLLIPVDDEGQHLLLLLPSGRLGAQLVQARDPLKRPLPKERQGALQINSSLPGTLRLSGVEPLTLAAERSRTIRLPGRHTFLFETSDGERLLAGALEVPAKGATELTLLPEQNAVQLTYHVPRR